MKELRCSTCGAPLNLTAGMSQCRCEYCGMVNVVFAEEKKAESTFAEAAAKAEAAGTAAGARVERGSKEDAIAKARAELGSKEEAIAKARAEAGASTDTEIPSDRQPGDSVTGGESKVVSIEGRTAKRGSSVSAKKLARSVKSRASKNAGFGGSVLRMYMVIMIVALLLVSFALNSASVMADEGNDLRSVPEAAKELEGKSWMDVVEYFRDCGFEEIEVYEEHDLSWDLFHRDGKVDEISIAGCRNFDKDATFYKDAKVIIYYHSMK